MSFPARKAREPDDVSGAPAAELPPLDVALRVPAATIAKLLVAAGLVFVLLRLWPALVLVFIAVLLAVALDPAVRVLERRGLSRSLSVAILAVTALGLAAIFLAVAMPPLVSQSVDFFQHLREYRRLVSTRLHADYPVLAKVADQIFDVPDSPGVAKSLKEPLAWGRVVIDAAEGIVLTLALSFYLLLDGKRTYAWLLAYVPRRHRRKMALTMP
ncbi:MAG TPA: AI-2E family transporter, partial [Thermoanaerobaculia bacterium]